MWVGFENLEPTIQGNSETGHQQIGNNSLAPQLPLEITKSIDSGSFFENSALNSVISNAKKRTAKINFCFLLSGVGGNDGRVHSAWNHLEAFLKLVFERYKLPTSQVQMQAILDGRDSGIHSSIKKEHDSGDFLGCLENLLDEYDARESLAWVIGRATAMDRDYRESAAKTDFDLLTGKAAHTVSSFNEIRKIIAESHTNGKTDHDIPSISMTRSDGTKPVLSNGDAFINLNFRSDRQRSKIGFLAGARSLLKSEGEARGRPWDGSWVEHNLNLDICTIAEYHPDFKTKYKVSVAFPTKPHPDNFLALWKDTVGSDEYTLVAESVKSSHMGYFFRGRREEPIFNAKEIRLITASHGQEDGVQSDTDFYLHPAMRTKEITAHVLKAIELGASRLICCNIAAPDMVGHLLPAKYEEAKVAYRAAADAVVGMAAKSKEFGLHMLITSDHGNIEDDTSAHSANDVLTTVIRADGTKFNAAIPIFQARLFDMGPTLFELMGAEQNDRKVPVENKEFAGRPLIKFE
jgi:2,3-bisphosphoglycerate-independent phosphoglycerate mutase